MLVILVTILSFMMIFFLWLFLPRYSTKEELIFILTFLELIFIVLAITQRHQHAVIMIILLEFFSIKGYIVLFKTMVQNLHPTCIYLYLALMVCEACLGLALVISLARMTGSDIASL